jgi:dipeptidyl aminopeptidase/acylaminoacyl peptidase
MKRKFVMASAFVAASLTAPQLYAANGLTIEHLNKLNKLTALKMSADGRYLVYGQKNGGLVPADTHADLYLIDLQNQQKVTRLTDSPAAEHSVQFSSDGQSIYFITDRTGSSQVWQLPLTGGEARQLTDLPLDVEGFLVSPDSKALVVAMQVKPGCADLACTVTANKQQADVKDTAQVYDQLMVRHWDTWEDGRRLHLFSASIRDGQRITTATNLMPEWDTDVAGTAEAAFTPDGKNLVFSAKIPAKDQAWHTNFDLFQVSLAGGNKINLTKDNPAWDAKPVFSADGRYMAYLAMKKPQAEADRFGVMLLDLATGERKELAPEWDRSVDELMFGPDNRTLYVTAQDMGQKGVFSINLSFGEVTKLYSDGTAGSLTVGSNQLAFINHSLDKPADVFLLKGNNARAITNINKDNLATIQFGAFEQFSFAGANGDNVYGYYVKPHNFTEGKKYPMAFIVHGGPQSSFGNMFNYRWNAQLWAAQGYGVVMIDFHGSTGYGQAFTDSISRDWGGKPLEDLKKGFAYIIEKQPWLDGSNACALGASYGGYMMNWIAGNWPTGFKCLVNHAGLFDMPSFYGSTEELWFPEYDMGGPVWNKDGDYHKFNPSAFVDNWQTPMLVIHGLKDYRVPYAQGLAAFTTLQRKGIDSRLVIFPDENHWILKPANAERWYNEVFRWMKQHTAQ